MSLGIYKPEDQQGPVHQCWRLFFTAGFLANPPAHFTVEGQTIRYELHDVEWVLTGRTLPIRGTIYEAEWPQ